MPTIPTTSPITGSGPTAPGQKPASAAMGKDDFLKLMTTQLRRQDPMNPVDDTAFLAQMAQFTSLEQMTNLAATASQQLSAEGVSQALSLTGRTVAYTTADGVTTTGVVDAVVFDRGVATLTVGGVPGISAALVTAVGDAAGGARPGAGPSAPAPGAAPATGSASATGSGPSTGSAPSGGTVAGPSSPAAPGDPSTTTE